ncbi:MAG: DUF2149 domain-containing protein [Shewanella sp.]
MKLKFIQKNSISLRQEEMDPLTGIANLFDASIVLIVSMMIALFTTFNLLGLMDQQSQVTITTKNMQGEVQIVTKQGTEIKVQKVTQNALSGEGVKLGTAFQLDDGRVVYVPD